MSAPKAKLKGAFSDAEQIVLARAAVTLAHRGPEAFRFGFSPLGVLSAASPRIGVAMTMSVYAIAATRAYPSVELGHLALAEARRDLKRALSAVTDAQYADAKKWLPAMDGNVPAAKSKAALVDAARQEAAERFPELQLRGKGKAPTAAVPKATAFAQIEQLALLVDDVYLASRAFDKALANGSTEAIRTAGTGLQGAIAKHGKSQGMFAEGRNRCKAAIETVVRSFKRLDPTAEGAKVVAALRKAASGLEVQDPAAQLYHRVNGFLDEGDLARIGEVAARIPPVAPGLAGEELANATRWRISTVKGVLGEIVAKKSTRYRRLRTRQYKRAMRFIDEPGNATWSVLVCRTPIRGLNKTKSQFAQFYDDAILITRKSQGRDTVAVVFAAQIKAGDPASLKALAQINTDILRERGGKLLVNGVEYDIVLGVLPTHRAMVTTTIGAAELPAKGVGHGPPVPGTPQRFAEELGVKELDVLDLPVDPADLDGFAAFLLRAAEKIPLK